MALLAFEFSPLTPPAISELLSPVQRMKTAGEVNSAILESLSQGKEAKLVGLLKLRQWGENLLGERAEFPKVRGPPCGLECSISTARPFAARSRYRDLYRWGKVGEARDPARCSWASCISMFQGISPPQGVY